MNITTREQGDIKVLRFEGRLDTNTSPHAQTTLDGLIEEGARKLVVDFETLD